MPEQVSVVVCLQWGDSGKGRLVDYLAPQHDAGVRFNGANNAGHTVVTDNGDKTVLHILPSTSVDKKRAVLTPGVLVDPSVLQDDILCTGIDPSFVYIDKRCPVITQSDIDEDRSSSHNKEKIGTTGRGVGPAMRKQIERIEGLRAGDKYRDLLNDMGVQITDTVRLLHSVLDKGGRLLFEGAQGFGLDIWHGSYPYCTSSLCTTGAVCTNAGIPWNRISAVYGVFKAYSTRVGQGPFMEILDENIVSTIRRIGQEYGATTGRPRRVGWLDADLLKHALRVNGCTHLCMTKADVLCGLPYVVASIDHRVRKYEGWDSLDSPAFSKYINDIEEYLGMRIGFISAGPRRNDWFRLPDSRAMMAR